MASRPSNSPSSVNPASAEALSDPASRASETRRLYIAVALRTGSPVFVARSVLDKAQVGGGTQDEQERIKKLLEEIDPEDLGDYEM